MERIAGERVRTVDIDVGNVVLYQLSYTRIWYGTNYTLSTGFCKTGEKESVASVDLYAKRPLTFMLKSLKWMVHKVNFFSVLFMLDDLVIKLLQLVPHCAVLLALIILSVVVLRLIRANLSKTELRPMDYLESFQKLHEEGKLTNEEYRIVKKLLSLQLVRSPDEPKPDYSLLNYPPPLPVDNPSGNIPKK